MTTKRNPEIAAAAVALGRMGGRAGRGACKRRAVTSEQARAAARARWDKYREDRLASRKDAKTQRTEGTERA